MTETIEPETEGEARLETLGQAAKAALDQCGGDVRKGADALKERVMADPDFLERHFGKVIRIACYDAVASVIRSERRQVWNTPQPTTEQRRAHITALASGTARTLLDFPLPGGKRLGDAGRAEVADAAAFYGDQSRDMAWKSRWLGLVAQSVPGGKRVSDVLSNERLEELRQETTR